MSDEITGAIAGVWDNVLTQLTQSGATREEIADMALDCAHVITERTFSALFPGPQEVAAMEAPYGVPLASAAMELAHLRSERALTRGPVPDVTDATDPGEGS